MPDLALETLSQHIDNSSRVNLEDADYSISLHDDIQSIKGLWDQLAPSDNIFLRSDYLKVLQKCHPENLEFRYAIVYSSEKPVGVCYLQLFQIHLGESFNKSKSDKPKSLIQKLASPIQNCIFSKGVYNVLICGNVLITGKHGYYFSEKELDEAKSIELARQTMDLAQKMIESNVSRKFQVQLFKDYPCKDDSSILDEKLLKAAYQSYTIQPAMYMKLPGHWKQFDDYLEEMQSKYRVRAKRAFKKGEELEKRELSLEEVGQYREEMYRLYQNIAKNVGFNAFTLNPDYFYELKLQLGEKVKIFAIFIDNKMVAFYSAIFNSDELEAHFLGLDHEANKEHHIYLNILYALIELGINHQMKMIDFARTALEIKSSVGAVPCNLNMYMRHRNRLSSKVMKFLFDNFTNEEIWQPRSPFKNMDIVR